MERTNFIEEFVREYETLESDYLAKRRAGISGYKSNQGRPSTILKHGGVPCCTFPAKKSPAELAEVIYDAWSARPDKHIMGKNIDFRTYGRVFMLVPACIWEHIIDSANSYSPDW